MDGKELFLENFRRMAGVEEAVTKQIGPDKWEYKGKKGKWRTGAGGDKIFIPDDGSGVMALSDPKAKEPVEEAKRRKASKKVRKADIRRTVTFKHKGKQVVANVINTEFHGQNKPMTYHWKTSDGKKIKTKGIPVDTELV